MNSTILCIAASILFYTPQNCLPQNSSILTADEYFSKAENSYANNDSERAISFAEKAIELDRNNDLYKSFMGLCLNEKGLKYYNEGRFDKAMPYLEKLLKYFPDDALVRQMYRFASDSLKQKEQSKKEKLNSQQLRTKQREVESFINSTEKWMQEQQRIMREEMVRQKREISEGLMIKTENERKFIYDEMRKKETAMIAELEKNNADIKKTYIVMTGIVAILVLTFIFIFVLVSQYSARRRPPEIDKSYLNILSRIEEKTDMALKKTPERNAAETARQEKTVPMSPGTEPATPKTMPVPVKIGPAPAKIEPAPVQAGPSKNEPQRTAGQPPLSQAEEKIRSIEIIESEISEMTDSATGKRLVSGFLADEDPGVRIRAIQSLYRYDAYSANKELELVLNNPSPAVRVKAVRILNSWTPSGAVKILINTIKDEKETPVIKEALHLMHELIRDKNRFIPDDLQKEGNELIKSLKQKDKWIVE